jgi:Domain of unknown function (DUF4037)
MTKQQELMQEAHKFILSITDDVAYEVTLTGSVARGMSDVYSDIEFDLWGESIPEISIRTAWLKSLNAENVVVRPEPEADGSEVIEFTLNSYEYELTWQTYTNLKALLAGKKSGDINQDIQYTGWSCYGMKVVKDRGLVQELITEFIQYPESLRQKIFFDTLESWYGSFLARVSAISRSEKSYSLNILQRDIKKLITLVYALNSRYEPYAKWVHHDLQMLTILPTGFVEKFESMFVNLDNFTLAWGLYIELLEGTLELIKTNAQPEVIVEVDRISNQLAKFKPSLLEVQ